MKNSFSNDGAVLWNSLPIELRQANSLDAFRAGCKPLLKIYIHGTYVKQALSLNTTVGFVIILMHYSSFSLI